MLLHLSIQFCTFICLAELMIYLVANFIFSNIKCSILHTPSRYPSIQSSPLLVLHPFDMLLGSESGFQRGCDHRDRFKSYIWSVKKIGLNHNDSRWRWIQITIRISSDGFRSWALSAARLCSPPSRLELGAVGLSPGLSFDPENMFFFSINMFYLRTYISIYLFYLICLHRVDTKKGTKPAPQLAVPEVDCVRPPRSWRPSRWSPPSPSLGFSGCSPEGIRPSSNSLDNYFCFFLPWTIFFVFFCPHLSPPFRL